MALLRMDRIFEKYNVYLLFYKHLNLGLIFSQWPTSFPLVYTTNHQVAALQFCKMHYERCLPLITLMDWGMYLKIKISVCFVPMHPNIWVNLTIFIHIIYII